VLFPQHLPIYVPRFLWDAILDLSSTLRIISPRRYSSQLGSSGDNTSDDQNGKPGHWVRLRFPINFVTAPLIADLFLLAILAIGRDEVHDGTVGADHISPIDIMAFFLTLAYIAISIDASGLIRYLAFKVLQKAGKDGPRLFFYLYAFFFSLGTFIGNDPIILSGTAFLAYMTRVSSNIKHPRAWIYTQFSVANTASAILVSSNPTNLVLAGAFNIKFVVYTANMIVPVVVTAIIMFPYLRFIVFRNKTLIPDEIKVHRLEDTRPDYLASKPVNPNIPYARGDEGDSEEEGNYVTDEHGVKISIHSLEEILNPFLDKGGATFGAVIMATTLVTILALNAASQSTEERPVFWVTLPAAFVMFCWDVGFGWLHRHETRSIARHGRPEHRQDASVLNEDAGAIGAPAGQEIQNSTALDEIMPTKKHSSEAHQDNYDKSYSEANEFSLPVVNDGKNMPDTYCTSTGQKHVSTSDHSNGQTPVSAVPTRSSSTVLAPDNDESQDGFASTRASKKLEDQRHELGSPHTTKTETAQGTGTTPGAGIDDGERPFSSRELDVEKRASLEALPRDERGPQTLVSITKDAYRWCQETFPTVTAVLTHLPWALVPFALSMFVLVQGLVTRGWVPVFAHGWDHWVRRTGTIGSIGGMGFLSAVLCNVCSASVSQYDGS
jgi:Na+/H+ antiporter NhaD/arsenite permease-like protein